MGRVLVDITTSLDGFVAGRDDGPELPLGEGGERLHQGRGCELPARVRASRSSASTAGTASRSTANGALPISRTSSSYSPARRSPDGDDGRTAKRAPGPTRTSGAHRRARPRGRALLVLLEVEHVLVHGRTDDLPAGLRLRFRLARQPDRRLRLRRLRGDRDRGHRGVVLERFPAMFGAFVKY
jgi:hypothetical protein